MVLEDEIAKWDGKSKSAIGSVYRRFHSVPKFANSLVEMFSAPALEKGATWLFKRHLEQAREQLPEALRCRVFALVGHFKHWESQLHILQSMGRLNVPSRSRTKAEEFIRSALSSENKFVRAWAYSAFYDLAGQFPRYQREAGDLLQEALTLETAASVKARIRRRISEGY